MWNNCNLVFLYLNVCIFHVKYYFILTSMITPDNCLIVKLKRLYANQGWMVMKWFFSWTRHFYYLQHNICMNLIGRWKVSKVQENTIACRICSLTSTESILMTQSEYLGNTQFVCGQISVRCGCSLYRLTTFFRKQSSQHFERSRLPPANL